MRAGRLPMALAALAAAGLAAGAAHANIYTWIDARGVVNVSNLPPPEGVRVLRDTPEPPRDPAREAAAREAARQFEVQALQDEVTQLRQELDATRREAVAPVVYPPPTVIVIPSPPVQYASAAPWPQYDYADVAAASGCDYGFNCGFWASPVVYPVAVPAYAPIRPHLRHGPRRDGRPIGRPPFSLAPLAPLAPLAGVPGAMRR